MQYHNMSMDEISMLSSGPSTTAVSSINNPNNNGILIRRQTSSSTLTINNKDPTTSSNNNHHRSLVDIPMPPVGSEHLSLLPPDQNTGSYLERNDDDEEEQRRLLNHVRDSPPGGTTTVAFSVMQPPGRRQRIYSTLAVSLLLGLVSGTLYGYGRYSMELKMTLGLSHFQLQLLGIMMDTGAYIGHPVVGYIYDQQGPRVSCLLGAVVVFTSFGTIHGIVTNTIPYEAWWCWNLLCVSFFAVGLGSGLGYTAALGTTTKNFQSIPQYRSLAVGIVASGFGFCSTLVGLSYHALGGLQRFFLFWAVLVASVDLLGSMVLKTEMPKRDGDTEENNDAVPIGGVDSNDNAIDPDSERLDPVVEREEPSPSQDDCRVVLIENHTSQRQAVVAQESESRLLLLQQQRKWAAVKSLDFWILFGVFGCCTGCGLFVINNVSTIVQSMGGTDAITGRLVILLSISNCVGRILVGSLADRPRVNKLTFFGFAAVAIAVSLFLSASTFSVDFALSCLFVTVVVVLVCYGGIWVLTIGILSDWFGTENFGKNFGIIAMGPALSGMMVNSASAWIYERHTNHTGSGDENSRSVCLGTDCYRGSFLLTGCAAMFSLLLLGCLMYRRNGKANEQ